MDLSNVYNLNHKIQYVGVEDYILGNIIYRNDLMKLFNMELTENTIINDSLFKKLKEKQDKLYEILKKDIVFNKIITLFLKSNKYAFFINNDKKMAFSLLFNYDTLWIIDEFIKNINNNNKKLYCYEKIDNFICQK